MHLTLRAGALALACANPPASLAEAAVTVTKAIAKIRRAAGRT